MSNDSKSNNSKYWVGGVITALVVVAVFFFGFLIQQTSEAYEMGVQNRERIAVMESKMDKLGETLDEVRNDVKSLLRTYPK